MASPLTPPTSAPAWPAGVWACQRPFTHKDHLGRTNLFRAKDLKVSTTAVRLFLLTAIPISDIGIASAISQATTDATLCLTAEAGRMERPIPASTSEISVGISPAV